MRLLISLLTLLLLAKSGQSQFTNILIDNIANPEEPSIAINPLNPNEMVAGSNVQNAYHSSDGGATWINDFLNSSEGQSGDPCLVADSLGNFFYFHLSGGLDRIVCQKSSDGGMTYSNGSFAWNNNSLLQDKEWATTDQHTNNLYVTWTEYDNGFAPGPGDSSRIYFSKSTDNGQSFSNAIRINEFQGDCVWLDITDAHPVVGPNSEIYVTFMDSSGIRFNRSLDTGNTWLNSQMLIDTFGLNRYDTIPGVTRIRKMPYNACDRSNSIYRGNIYVSWADTRNGQNNSDIFFIKSTDGGNSWSTAIKVNSDSSNNFQFRNAMAVDQTNGFIYIVYYDRRNYSGNDSTDVYLSKSTDGGDHWTDYKISSTGYFSDGSVFDGDYIDIAAHDGIIRPIWTTVDNSLTTGVWTCLFNESTVNIPQPEKSNITFTVNPNPADVIAVVSFSNEMENTKGVILDASGRIVKSFMLNHEREKIIDIHELPAGVYFVKAGNVSRKLIVEK